MAEFVTFASWLREPPAIEEPAVLQEPVALEIQPEVGTALVPERALIDDICARVRRFRAMLADASDYVHERGAPRAPLTVRVHPAQQSLAEAIGLPLVADTQLGEEEAVIELRCGSIDARLQVPIRCLLAQHTP
ncbi:MAG: hypothetical protein WBD74_05235 [Candidatus Aquilonibacter sp.]